MTIDKSVLSKAPSQADTQNHGKQAKNWARDYLRPFSAAKTFFKKSAMSRVLRPVMHGKISAYMETNVMDGVNMKGVCFAMHF